MPRAQVKEEKTYRSLRKKGERKKIETIAENRGPIMLGESPKKGEELGGAPS